MKYILALLLFVNIIICNFLFYQFTLEKNQLDLQIQHIEHEKKIKQLKLLHNQQLLQLTQQCKKTLYILQKEAIKQCNRRI